MNLHLLFSGFQEKGEVYGKICTSSVHQRAKETEVATTTRGSDLGGDLGGVDRHGQAAAAAASRGTGRSGPGGVERQG
jgi:hypothetical protein